MPAPKRILEVAVPCPLRGSFDYLGDDRVSRYPAGARVRVPFGHGRRVGIVLGERARSEVPRGRLRAVEALLDEEALLPGDLLALGRWLADYYKQPVGECFAALMPAALRRGGPADPPGETVWRLTATGRRTRPSELEGAPRQAGLLAALHRSPGGLGGPALRAVHAGWRDGMRALQHKGLVAPAPRDCAETAPGASAGAPARLTDEQRACAEALGVRLPGFSVSLLEGITGSGKTEVYFELMERVLARGRQVLLLVPEIGLTPQLIDRLRARFARPLAVMHSGLTDTERHCAWSLLRRGRADIGVGTRSAVFAPMARPGLLVVDEEHDLSYKQQDGLRYHARDVAVMRAKLLDVPVLLASATPSLETLRNVEAGRYHREHLSRRPGAAVPPRLSVVDLRNRRLVAGLSETLLANVDRHLEDGGQALLYLNRRGYAPVLLCHHCGWSAHCARCDALLTLHRGRSRLRCHHCGGDRPASTRCPECGAAELVTVGQGTERLEEMLAERFGTDAVVRIDRDTTRRKGSLEARLARAHSGEARVLIGTQMLTKGHDFPGITLVGIVDADGGLFAVDLRATEQLAQQIVQVIGRAGRAQRPGEALIQTHHPDHPLLATLLQSGYRGFARAALAERREAGMPPYAAQALFRAEATGAEAIERFLQAARALLDGANGGEVQVVGPMPAPMERRAGRFRFQLLAHAPRRAALHALLDATVADIAALPAARAVRWSLDVDPVEMY